MTRTAPQRTPPCVTDLLLEEAQADPEALTLLAAYRDAAEIARQATGATLPTQEEESAASEDESNAGVGRRGLPSVLRLRMVAGLAPELLGPLHGRLLAAGYLTAEIVGRADGLAYRLTREGLRKLAGEVSEAEAA